MKDYSDLIGQKFGKLTIKFDSIFDKTDKYATRKWAEFECECGDVKISSITEVLRGRITSCKSCSSRKSKPSGSKGVYKSDYSEHFGQTFGKLYFIPDSVTREEYGRSVEIYAEFLCECGKTKKIRAKSVVSGETKSCNCYGKEVLNKRHTTHGLSKTTLYKRYMSMLNRCYDDKRTTYKYYGGRGIIVCDRWLESYENFKEDMQDSFKPELSLDRIDTNGNYEPSNCRWATASQQARNQRHIPRYELHGETKTLMDWCEQLDLCPSTVKDRVKRQWTIERALTTPTSTSYTDYITNKRNT